MRHAGVPEDVRACLLALEGRIERLEFEAAGNRSQMRPIAGGELQAPAFPPAWTLSSNTTLAQTDMRMWHHINCTADADLTLPTAVEGDWVGIVNVGTEEISVKDGATKLIKLKQNQWAYVPSLTNSSVAPEWPDAVVGYGYSAGGEAVIVMKDSAAAFWEGTVDTVGAFTGTSIGT